MNPTNEQRLRAFMLYNGVWIFAENRHFKITGKVSRWDFGETEAYVLLVDSEGEQYQFEVDECSLILREISDLTEEEKRELAKMSGYNMDEIIAIESGRFSIMFHADKYSSGFNWSDMPYQAADYLRSKNIALPFEGIDLFESGIAVKQ